MCELLHGALVGLLLASHCTGLQIESFSGELLVTRRGEELELFCESSSPYQWCYWAHGDEEYRTITGDESFASPISFEWIKSSTKCGLKIASVEDEHAGQWKCHLADTDEEEVTDIRDERHMEVFVAHPATVQISVPETLLVTYGEEVEVGCVVEEEGNPAPSVTLFHESRSEEKQDLGDGGTVTYSPSLEDTGSAFYCFWEQVGPDGEVIFHDKVHSTPIEVIMAPVVLDSTPVEYEFVEDMEISVQFMAKPWPQEGDIIWYLQAENQSMVEIEHSMEQGHFQVEDLREIGENPYELETILQVFELTENITVTVEILNSAGSSVHQFELYVPIPPTTIPPTTIPPTTELITSTELGLVGGLLFGIILVCLSFILFRKKSTPVKVDGGSKRSSGDEKPNIYFILILTIYETGYFPSEPGSKRNSGMKSIINIL